MTTALFQRYLKPALGLAVLAALFLALDTQSLLQAFARSNPWLFAAGLLTAFLANLVCIKRWQLLAQVLKLHAGYGQLASFYFQGIAVSSVLPGGMVGADVWRSLALQQLSKRVSAGSKGTRSAVTVFLDRLTGFWGLAFISLGCALLLVTNTDDLFHAGVGQELVGSGYMVVLGVLVFSPLVLRAPGFALARWLFVMKRSRRLRAAYLQMQALIKNSILGLKLGSLSILSQALTIASFCLCLSATGLVIDWLVIGFLCTAIFLLSILPASIGGFGARELAATALLVPFGYKAELVVVGSLLFGLTATLQGLIGLLSWVGQPRIGSMGSSENRAKKPSLVIGHVLLSRGFAGSERSTAESCNAQCKSNSVFIVLRQDHRLKNGASIEDALDPRVRRYFLGPGLWGRLREGAGLRAIFEAEQPDIVHAHLRRATRLVAKTPTSAARIATLHVECNSPYYLQMDGLVCNAQWQLNSVASSYDGRLLKANNSVVHEPAISAEQRQVLRSALGLDETHFFVGCVGRLTHEKGWDQVFAAFKELGHLKQLRGRIFGTGREERALQELCRQEPRIRLEGFRADIKPLYQAMDVLVCASRFEPLPRVILEAMDAGTPVIASDADGCLELINDHGGRLFSRDNPSSLAIAIEEEFHLGPRRHHPNLNDHYLDQANSRIEAFYRECLSTMPA